MVFDKETLIKLSSVAHTIIAVILCRLTSTIVEKILLLICVGTVGGIQCICVRKTCKDKNDKSEKDVGKPI